MISGASDRANGHAHKEVNTCHDPKAAADGFSGRQPANHGVAVSMHFDIHSQAKARSRLRPHLRPIVRGRSWTDGLIAPVNPRAVGCPAIQSR